MPKLIIDVPDYSPERGLQAEWDEGVSISVRIVAGNVLVQANTAGLRSLAHLLLGMTSETVPAGAHWHLDDCNSLEDGSVPIIIERTR